MKSLIDNDVYWGEFSEKDMDEILLMLSKDKYSEAKEYIDKKLKRTEFIFGRARSDFLYCMDLKKDFVCMDIGCGLGVHTFNLAPYVKEVHALDLSRKRVEFCEYRKKFEGIENVHLYHTDVDHLPFPDETFDVVLMNGVVEWLGERNHNSNPRDDQVEILKKIRSLLKKDGVLYIGIENRFALTYLHNAKDHNRLKYTTFMPRFLADFVTKIFVGKSYRTYTYGISGYKKLLADSGFNLSRTDFFVAHPGYNLPQYLIDYTDISAFRFFIMNAYGTSKWASVLIPFIKHDWFIKIIRHVFYSYAIFAKK